MVAVGFLDTQTGDLNYEPTAIYGTKLAAPIVMDAYSAGFANSPVISRRPFRTEDMVRDKRVLTPYRQIASRMSLKNCLIVPLVINQRSLGEIIIANRLAGEFTEADEQLLLTIGAQIAAAVERGRLNATSDADLRTRLEEQESIERLNRELSETLILDGPSDVIRNEVLRSTPAQEVSVVLFKPSSEWVTADRPEVESRMGLILSRSRASRLGKMTIQFCRLSDKFCKRVMRSRLTILRRLRLPPVLLRPVPRLPNPFVWGMKWRGLFRYSATSPLACPIKRGFCYPAAAALVGSAECSAI